jgi:serine/threonine-protein kinase
MVLGRYVLHDEIAAGGAASVHLGRQTGAAGFARTVAIKRLHPHVARDPELASMLVDEARLAARIRHPNVVSTLDVEAKEGELFLIMEYVHGEPLSRLIRNAVRGGSKIPPPIVATIMAGALHGLHAAHEARDEQGELLELVHRDISPQNILVGADGVARVLDFGIAKSTGRIQSTQEGQVKGKFAYMPPEQLHGDVLDRRADVYAAGVVLWEALAGARLFLGSAEMPDLQRLLDADVEPPSSRVPDLPPAFDAVTMKALRRSPDDRFASAREMALAIEACGPMAPASEVSAWVERWASASLAERAQQIAAIEEQAISEPVPATSKPASIGTASNETASNETASNEPPIAARPPMITELSPTLVSRPLLRSRRSASLRVGALIAALALIGVALAARRSTQESSAVALPAPTSGMGIEARPAPSTLPEPAPLTVVDPPAVSTSPAAPSSATAASSAARAAKVSAAPRPRPSPGACSPPFTVDAQGHKKYKRECLEAP